MIAKLRNWIDKVTLIRFCIYTQTAVSIDNTHRHTASLEGHASAHSFKEACDIFYKDKRGYNEDRGTYFNLKLYSNEKDARENVVILDDNGEIVDRYKENILVKENKNPSWEDIHNEVVDVKNIINQRL